MSIWNEFTLVLGEDDRHDIMVMKRVLKQMEFQGELVVFTFGKELLDYLLKEGEYAEASHEFPQLLVLDINLPGVSGKEILDRLRQNEDTRHIPVLMCSGSTSLRDFHDCISGGANAYIQKSADLTQFMRACQLFIEGWLVLSRQEFY